ncbi:hypothetical protein [Paenibacillus hexagrammi]|uniref:Uncharacterized protein n=1 Tax=Paenibacillus hexagrammi TaxID=2908839 RepID=A0ABY3SUJ5_9BACL|nr:hypothetical protein [Paenibacillus sp. YPD9-1]UJF36597.1 hypothetical protein L0M14_30375 [Paenibacillus sp. YPD9-1]
MTYTASEIMNLSVNTPKHWLGDGARPAFADSVFRSNNWNCASMNIMRRVCYDLFDELGTKEGYNDPDAWLTGDVYSGDCWFDYESNQAEFACHINGHDVLGFRFQDHTFVFFVGEEVTYMVQWYKNRGRTEWLLKLEGTEMGTAQPVTAQEYADLLNAVIDHPITPHTAVQAIQYNFWWIDQLEAEECEGGE